MTTALQIVNRAAEIIGHKDPDEALSGNDASNFLGVLNDLLGAWNTDRLYVLSSQTVSASVSASPVSIGAGQTMNTPRPARIEGMWSRVNGIDYPITQRTSGEYDGLADKATTGDIPTDAYYEPSAPYGAIYLYPVPSAAITLYARVMTQLSEFADLSTDYSLGTGYKRALEYSLAEELGVSHGNPAKLPAVIRMASNARRAIKQANYEPVLMNPVGLSRIVFDIVTGQ